VHASEERAAGIDKSTTFKKSNILTHGNSN
jgi:hypothetical protein